MNVQRNGCVCATVAVGYVFLQCSPGTRFRPASYVYRANPMLHRPTPNSMSLQHQRTQPRPVTV